MAAAMAPLVPATATALVPVPRAKVRRWAHGVDPARMLADALSVRCGVQVVAALRPSLWWPRHAARGNSVRSHARFRAVVRPEPSWVLIDDVATSGATLDAASAALGGVVRLAVVATSPSRVNRVGLQHGSPVGDRMSGRRLSQRRARLATLLPWAGKRTGGRGRLAAPELRRNDR
jgi:hypothetical protein